MFPTETVYGVGADARRADAVERVFVAKGRPADRAITVHVARGEDVERWAASVPSQARRLMEAYWPGPLTIVLPARSDVPEVLRGGGHTVGLRVPDHPLALELIDTFGSGIAGSSANAHGESAATTVDEAQAILGGEVDVYIDGGRCRIGAGSTVLDLSLSPPRMLRAGALSVDEIERVLGEAVAGVDQ